MNLKVCWLTINRDCNLRCSWCYAQSSNFDKKSNMSLSMAMELVDICAENNVENFLLTGGEPALHPDFFEIAEYILNKSRTLIVVSNGIIFQNEDFCNKLKLLDNGKLHLNISLKASTDEGYENVCGKSEWKSVVAGIDNCRKKEFKFMLTHVISSENVHQITTFAEQIRSKGIVEYISFAVCRDINLEGDIKSVNKMHPLEIDKVLSDNYETFSKILDNRFLLHQSLPLCMCNKDLFNKMVAKNQVKTACHVQNRSGVVFDTDGSVLLCNHFNGVGVGKYRKDFVDASSFREYWDSEYVTNLHKKLVAMPSLGCAKCDMRSKCGGGCCIQWFSHDFASYKSKYLSLTN